MEKKFEDDELDKLLEEQYMKEADMIEEALFSDENFEDFEETDEEVRAAYDKLVARLKADGIYREDDDNDAEKESSCASGSDEVAAEIEDKAEAISAQPTGPQEHEGKVIPMRGAEERGEEPKGKKRYMIAKVAGFVVVATMCVFAASMTSEANRNYFINKVRYLAGDDTRIVVSNDEMNDKSVGDEYQAITTIEKQLGVRIPEFMYRPSGFEFKVFYVDDNSETASIEYEYKNNIIILYIDKEDVNNSSKIDSLHGDSVETFPIDDGNVLVSIKEIKDAEDILSSYVAQWEKDNVIYAISGKIEKEELIKLLGELAY